MPDPIAEDDAETMFALETEVARTRSVLKVAKLTATEAKVDYEDARTNLEKFIHGLKERHPLFDRDDDDRISSIEIGGSILPTSVTLTRDDLPKIAKLSKELKAAGR